MSAVEPPSPIVIYRLGSLGDTVVALPCLHRIATSFPHAERIALTNVPVNSKASALATIIGDSGLVQRYVDYPVGLRSIKGFIALRKQLKALGSTTLVYLAAARGLGATWRDIVFFRLCGFTTIIGAPTSADLQSNRRDADGHLEQEFSRMARCIATLGPIDLDSPASWDLRFTPAELDRARELMQPISAHPFFVINMGGKVSKNDWGIDNWLQLLDRLAEPLGGHALVVLGGPEDEPRARSAVERWRGPGLDLCGRGSPRVSGAVAAGATLFIGHDSGPLHLTASVGVPCVGLFGDNNPPRKWHPWGRGHRVIHKMEGVMAIRVDEVVAAVKQVLAAQTGAHVTAVAS